jgi:hypothetical protein
MNSGELSVSIPCTATISLSLMGSSSLLGAPRVYAIDPCDGHPGTVVTAVGEALDRTSVTGVFLADRDFDWKAEIVSQSQNVLRFRIPECTRPGRQRILLVARGDGRELVEQSVTFQVL